jgi:hypothetical protein
MNKHPKRKTIKVKMDMKKLLNVTVENLFCPLFIIKNLNNNGCMVYDINTTDKMPIIETKAIDLRAG